MLFQLTQLDVGIDETVIQDLHETQHECTLSSKVSLVCFVSYENGHAHVMMKMKR